MSNAIIILYLHWNVVTNVLCPFEKETSVDNLVAKKKTAHVEEEEEEEELFWIYV